MLETKSYGSTAEGSAVAGLGDSVRKMLADKGVVSVGRGVLPRGCGWSAIL